MMGDGSLPKYCPTKYQRLVIISGDYYVFKYCVTNSLDKTKFSNSVIPIVYKNKKLYIFTTWAG